MLNFSVGVVNIVGLNKESTSHKSLSNSICTLVYVSVHVSVWTCPVIEESMCHCAVSCPRAVIISDLS